MPDSATETASEEVILRLLRNHRAVEKSVTEKGLADFSFFRNYEFQPDHPLDRLLIAHYQCCQKDGVMEVQIPIVEGGVKKNSARVTEYYFDLVLLYGDATTDDGLRVETDTSKVYS